MFICLTEVITAFILLCREHVWHKFVSDGKSFQVLSNNLQTMESICSPFFVYFSIFYNNSCSIQTHVFKTHFSDKVVMLHCTLQTIQVYSENRTTLTFMQGQKFKVTVQCHFHQSIQLENTAVKTQNNLSMS